MSELVTAHSSQSSADDLNWLHALLNDLQLLADLAFADIVLWTPSADGFVAVAHARPSSAATLFYRDFVGQTVKPDWRRLVTDSFERGEILDSSAPDWFEETPTRVRAVPGLPPHLAVGDAAAGHRPDRGAHAAHEPLRGADAEPAGADVQRVRQRPVRG